MEVESQLQESKTTRRWRYNLYPSAGSSGSRNGETNRGARRWERGLAKTCDTLAAMEPEPHHSPVPPHDDPDTPEAAGGKKHGSWFSASVKKIDNFFKKLGTSDKPASSSGSGRKVESNGGRFLSLVRSERREELQRQREKVIALKEQLNAMEMAARTGDYEGNGDRRRMLEGKVPPVEASLAARDSRLEKKMQQLHEELREAEHTLKTLGEEVYRTLVASKKLAPAATPQGEEDEAFVAGWEIDPADTKCLKKLGEGEFGVTYQGEFRGRVVAVKRLKVQFPNPKLIEESKQELRLLSHLHHPNVVLFMGACTVPEEFCVVTELMEGGSLFDLLHKQQKQLDRWMVVQWAKDIAYGMNYLHHQKPQIIHRDLKSGNLLINKYLHLKIGDFGLARFKAESGIMTAETGSYRWMAPEVIRHEKYNEKVDVYSFALVVWEMLTGQMPFVGYTPVQAAMAVARQGARPPIPSGCPPRLASMIERCWASRPDDRPAFSEVLGMLDEIEREMVLEQAKAGTRTAKSY
eukprot:tig00020961_g16661.t1